MIIRPTLNKNLREFEEILDTELINSALTQDLKHHNDTDDLKVALSKAICDVFTSQLNSILRLGWSSP